MQTLTGHPLRAHFPCLIAFRPSAGLGRDEGCLRRIRMRRQFFLCSAVLVLILIACVPRVMAQFTEPKKEELEMKVDPKAPDAAAVYLYREEITDQVAKTRTLHERMKVLTEKGK